MISLTASDLTDVEQDMLRRLLHQTADGPIVYALVAKGLAEVVETDSPDYHAVRLTSAGREIADEGDD